MRIHGVSDLPCWLCVLLCFLLLLYSPSSRAVGSSPLSLCLSVFLSVCPLVLLSLCLPSPFPFSPASCFLFVALSRFLSRSLPSCLSFLLRFFFGSALSLFLFLLFCRFVVFGRGLSSRFFRFSVFPVLGFFLFSSSCLFLGSSFSFFFRFLFSSCLPLRLFVSICPLFPVPPVASRS